MYSRRQLAKKVALTNVDLIEISRCRRDYNRLGFGYQVGFVRLLNRFPQQHPFETLDELLTFTGVQLELEPSLIAIYEKRQPTISEHQQRIANYLQLRMLGGAEQNRLEEFVFEESCRLEQAAVLQARAKEFLKGQQILQPADFRIERIVGEQRKKAREYIFAKIAANIPVGLAHKLDALLDVEPGSTISDLQRIKANPSKPGVEAMKTVLRKLKVIEATGVLSFDLAWLNSNYQRALFHQVRNSSAYRLRELATPRRHAALVCFLWQSYRDAVDQAVDMFDKLMTKTQTKAKVELNEHLLRQRKSIRLSQEALKALSVVILEDSSDDESAAELRERLFAQVSRENLEARVKELDEWLIGKRSDHFYGVVRRYSDIRKFSPALLAALDISQNDTSEEQHSCLSAVQVLRKMNASGKRKLPDGAPADFVPSRLRSIVGDGDKVDKHAWECALLLQLRDEIRSGNLSVKNSKRFGKLDDFFIDGTRWSSIREDFFRRAGLPSNPHDVTDHLKRRLGEAFDRFDATAPQNSYATVDDKGWKLSVDPAEKLDETAKRRMDKLKAWLASNMRRIRLPDLLIEVDNDVGFTHHFMSPAQRRNPAPHDICLTLASVMAHGCNIGTYTMAQLTPDASYEQLKRISDWQFTQDTQRKALAAMVGAISNLDTSLHWGEGKTSASDGQRFSLRRKVLQQTYSTKFSDFALEFYTFVADNYAPYYSSPIECTDRDSGFVLDGLLYNESELELEEHYTDTHGYTEVNFAAFTMLGRRFCPRIRGMKKQRIYRIDKERNYGALASLVSRADRTIDPDRAIVEQWDRMGQLYASLESGQATASVALKRLAGYSAKNSFYRANRDLGRIFKTEFILQYMSEPALRSRVRRGLLKVEQLHALARDVYYAHRGQITDRELWEQMNNCSCLTLIIACIVYWQASEITRIIRDADPEQAGVDLSLLEHVSPIEWKNVVLYGQYVLDRKRVRGHRAVALSV